MQRRPLVATIVSLALLAQTSFVHDAGAAERDDASATTLEADPRPDVPSFRFSAAPNVLEAAARLASPNLSESIAPGHGLAQAAPKAIMSNNTKTVVIVAIIAGAALILVGVIAVGKPFKKP